MKLFFLSLSLLLVAHQAQAKDAICKRSYIKTIVAASKAHTGNDKNMHCSTSCMLTLRCHSSSVITLGYMKELQDIFTPGDADWNDIKADMVGINMVLHKRSDSDKECFEQCDLVYSP